MKALKKIFLTLCILTVLLAPSFLAVPQIASAHELIPQQLKEYINAHPDATPDQIKAFADQQAPEFAKKFRDGAEIVNIMRNQNSSLLDNSFDFFKLGIKHILSGPDHILFVISLLLVFISWREIFKLTGTFTVAHSITLVLAGTGLLTLSPRIVEPFIAFSIAYVAFTTVFLRGKKFVGEEKGKIAMVFFFGLFHGLGFAGLLKEIQIPADKFISSLVSFNLGIEAGQLIIVATAFPFIYYFRHELWYPKAIKILGAIITLLGLIWGIQRIIG